MRQTTSIRSAAWREFEHIRLRLGEALRHPSQSPLFTHPVQSARSALDLIEASVEGIRDLHRLKRDLPALRTLDQAVAKATGDLEVTYHDYISTVSQWDWAISLELAAVILGCCRLLQPARVLDTGSGYSSYVLRRYAAESPRQVSVTSVDLDQEWLDRTRTYLRGLGLASDGTVTWDRFREQGGGEFDLVMHDLGAEDERARTLQYVVGLVRPAGVILLDDVGNPHMRSYGRYARRTLASRHFRSYSLRVLTRERRYSRYSMLGMRSPRGTPG